MAASAAAAPSVFGKNVRLRRAVTGFAILFALVHAGVGAWMGFRASQEKRHWLRESAYMQLYDLARASASWEVEEEGGLRMARFEAFGGDLAAVLKTRGLAPSSAGRAAALLERLPDWTDLPAGQWRPVTVYCAPEEGHPSTCLLVVPQPAGPPLLIYIGVKVPLPQG